MNLALSNGVRSTFARKGISEQPLAEAVARNTTLMRGALGYLRTLPTPRMRRDQLREIGDALSRVTKYKLAIELLVLTSPELGIHFPSKSLGRASRQATVSERTEAILDILLCLGRKAVDAAAKTDVGRGGPSSKLDKELAVQAAANVVTAVMMSGARMTPHEVIATLGHSNFADLAGFMYSNITGKEILSDDLEHQVRRYKAGSLL